jgi:hypothetical protein
MFSTGARAAAKNNDLAKLNELVNPQVAAKVIEKFGSLGFEPVAAA